MNGGMCRKLWKHTARVTVTMNRATITPPPFLIRTSPLAAGGVPRATAKCMMVAGINQFTSDGRNRWKNPQKSMIPRCHTIRVVMSPKGLNAPPALAATTMLMQASETNLGLSRPTASTTAHITSAVVRLSMIGDRQNASTPVVQNSCR